MNFSPTAAQARVPLPWSDLAGSTWQLADPMQSVSFDRDGGELADQGLFVELDPWRYHLLTVSRR